MVLPHSRPQGTTSNKENKNQIFFASANKPDQFSDLGVTFSSRNDGQGRSYLCIESCDGVFNSSPLALGDEVISINNVSCADKDRDFAQQIIEDSNDTIVIAFRPRTTAPGSNIAETTAIKPNTNFDVGLAFKTISHKENQSIIISSIDPHGLFAETSLSVGDELISINNISCIGENAEFAREVVNISRNRVTIVAKQSPDISTGSDVTQSKKNKNKKSAKDDLDEETMRYVYLPETRKIICIGQDCEKYLMIPSLESNAIIIDEHSHMNSPRTESTDPIHSSIMADPKEHSTKQSIRVEERKKKKTKKKTPENHRKEKKVWRNEKSMKGDKRVKKPRKTWMLYLILGIMLLCSAIVIPVRMKRKEALDAELISGISKGENMGESVSLSSNGQLLAIGGFENVRLYKSFENEGTPWVPEIDLSNSMLGGNFRSFCRVALSPSGSFLIVGKPDTDSNGSMSGTVIVFSKINNVWKMVGSPIHGDVTNEFFGVNVAISDEGKRLAASTLFGDVRVFDFGNNDWRIYSSFKRIGSSLAMSGSGEKLAISNPLSNLSTGSVLIYDLTTLDPINKLMGDTEFTQFGNSIAFSNDGSTLAVAFDSKTKAGVTVYRQRLGSIAFSQFGRSIIGPMHSRFGAALSLSNDGRKLAIGAPRSDNKKENSGRTFLYEIKNQDWSQIDTFEGRARGDESGSSVSLSGDGSIIAIGSPRNDSGGSSSGVVRVTSATGTSFLRKRNF